MENNDLFWVNKRDDGISIVGLTDKAFDMFGQLWAIIPTNERKRNFAVGEQLLALEGSDALGTLDVPFQCKRVQFNGEALERPDELTSQDVLFFAEVA